MGSRFKGGIAPGAMPWKNRYIGNPALTGNPQSVLPLWNWRRALRAASDPKGRVRKLRLTSSGMEFASEMVDQGVAAEVEIDRGARDPIARFARTCPTPPPVARRLAALAISVHALADVDVGVPALTAIAIGLAILTTALARALGWAARCRSARAGSWSARAADDRWPPWAGMMGIASHLYGVREGYRQPKPTLLRMRNWLSLESCVITGLALLFLSAASLAGIGIYWGSERFAALPSVLPVTLAGLAGTTGLQTLLGGFLLAVVGGNEADFFRPADQPA
jgi:hypothetical protein